MKFRITEADVTVENGWIYVNHIGRIGLFKSDIKTIGLDFSIQCILQVNTDIPCERNQIKQKIVDLINNN